jgi:hypothetical protein
VLERVKRWVLAVLAMLARKGRAARGSARLRSRRVKDAALLTRSARRSLLRGSGRSTSLRFSTACGASNKARGLESKIVSLILLEKIAHYMVHVLLWGMDDRDNAKTTADFLPQQ